VSELEVRKVWALSTLLLGCLPGGRTTAGAYEFTGVILMMLEKNVRQNINLSTKFKATL